MRPRSRAVIAFSAGVADCGPASATLVTRYCGENTVPQHALPVSATRSGPPRNSVIYRKALSGRGLAIRAAHPRQWVRRTGRAGATPRKTALTCAIRPFGEVAPEIFPYRKAGGPWRIAEVSTQGFRAGMRCLSGA